MITLYHYLHCPFCIRVRMVLGFLSIPYNSKVLAYNDEQTPIKLTGKKMLPIVTFSQNDTSNESLDIIRKLDHANKLNTQQILNDPQFSEIENLLNLFGSNVHKVAMPYFIYTPEFDQQSREYFQQKKEAYKGPFRDLYKKRKYFCELLQNDLKKIEPAINPFYKSNIVTLYDILIASHLWAMYIVPEFQFSTKIHEYLQKVGRTCHFEYHKDNWN